MQEASLPSRVLIVDDDPMLGRLLLRYLSRAGIPADVADSLAAAQTAFEPGSHSHAVVDLTLPDGSGAEWLTVALRADQNLQGVLASGYPVTADLLPLDLRPQVRILQKPFSPSDLLQALNCPTPG